MINIQFLGFFEGQKFGLCLHGATCQYEWDLGPHVNCLCFEPTQEQQHSRNWMDDRYIMDV
jgi:hypothetical protein